MATDTATSTDTSDLTLRAATVFKALSDPLRIQLVALTRAADEDGICFCDLASHFTMPQSSLSHHLRVLVDAGLLERERRGTWSWYRLRRDQLDLLQAALRPDGRLLQTPNCCDPPTAGHRRSAPRA